MLKKIINYIQGNVFEDIKKINKINKLTYYLHIFIFIIFVLISMLVEGKSIENIIVSCLGHIFIIIIVYFISIYKQTDLGFQAIAINTNFTLSFFVLYLWVQNFTVINIGAILFLMIPVLIINKRVIIFMLGVFFAYVLSYFVIIIKNLEITNLDFSNILFEFSFILVSFIVFVSMMNISKSLTFYIEKEKAENKKKQRKQDELLYSILSTLENISMNYESDGTCYHNKRVQLYTIEIAKKLQLSKNFIEEIRIAAPLHDVGKIMIDQKVLTKPTSLNTSERNYLESHVTRGYEVIKDLNLGKTIENIIKYHHERWDGNGYPYRLKGENIPLEARILSVCDVYDALRSPRSYKVSWSHNNAVEEIKNKSGVLFDPNIVELFIEHKELFNQIFLDNK